MRHTARARRVLLASLSALVALSAACADGGPTAPGRARPAERATFRPALDSTDTRTVHVDRGMPRVP